MSKRKNKSGFSLVEIMVASLLIAVLAIGGATVLYHTGSIIGTQKLKRQAIDQAIARMELMKRTRYSIIRPSTPEPDIYYYVDDDQDDLLESGELGLSQSVEAQKEFSMITTIERIPPPTPGLVEGEYLVVNVTVTYDRTGQQVVLESLIAPDL